LRSLAPVGVIEQMVASAFFRHASLSSAFANNNVTRLSYAK
jgi:hypothetical protein